ncbi:trimethylamine N-oxide reductase system protein TorE [Photobacterium aquae]|uniref:trimethylamine N-oxide reductase system protein TorE n=1 Tax=Photobacterium aquae TaxID=1195763 RepID=UPI000A0520F5|nr:trimethylamine N-oxide reductase system protein TorE [Photobacterium aquae]
MNNEISSTAKDEKKREWGAFFFITVFLFPILSIITVGGYGFIVWMMQVFLFGPPGHGA